MLGVSAETRSQGTEPNHNLVIRHCGNKQARL